MKAKTINQKRVIEVSDSIKPIGKEVIAWAENHVFNNHGIRYKSGTMNCLKCGHRWQSDMEEAWHDEIMEHVCPGCKKALVVKATQNRTKGEYDYFSIIEKAEEYQVVRTFWINAFYKCQQKAEYHINEGIRVFINEKGRREVVAKLRGGSFGYGDYFSGEMVLRRSWPDGIQSKYSVEGLVYPEYSVQDFITRVGVTMEMYDQLDYPFSTIASMVLRLPFCETILKSGNLPLFKYTLQFTESVYKRWPTLRICLRRRYKVKNPGSYFDMLLALEFFNKDLLNHQYVCPPNFRKGHDFWINKKANVLEKQRQVRLKENRIKELLKQEKEKVKYEDRMEKFKEFKIEFGDLVIAPLLKLEHVAEAGDLMDHCIFKTSRYWKDPDNLLLATYYKGKMIETTQYVLGDKRVVHSYGRFNKHSDFHQAIVSAIRDHEKEIAKCLRKKKPKKQVA